MTDNSLLEDYFTEAEMCTMLSCRPRTLRRYERLGLRPTIIRRKKYFEKVGSRAWVAKQERDCSHSLARIAAVA